MINSEIWRRSNLSGVEATVLKQTVPLLPFLADLATAMVNLYAPTPKSGEYILLSVQKPHTLFLSAGAKAGSLVAASEEPLVKFTFDEKKPIRGRREVDTAEPDIVMTTFPLFVGKKTAAVVTIETTEAVYNSDGYGQIMKTVEMLLEGKRDYGGGVYRPIGETDGVIIADKFDRIVFANLSAQRVYRVLGISNLVGMVRTDRLLTRHITSETTKSDQPNEKEITAGGLVLVMRDIPLEEAGQLKRRIVIIEDVTAIREKEKEIRLQKSVNREIHHRVKNNLQSIASLLNLQARRMVVPEAKEALKESAGRVRSIATIHEYLSNQGTDTVDATALVQNLLTNVQEMLPPSFVLIRRFSGGTFHLKPEMTTSFALAINELLLNMIRHAFVEKIKKGRRGTISFHVERMASGWRLELADDGCGLPPDFNLDTTRSLGLTLIKNFIRDDLNGLFSLENIINAAGIVCGTKAIIEINDKGEEDEQ